MTTCTFKEGDLVNLTEKAKGDFLEISTTPHYPFYNPLINELLNGTKDSVAVTKVYPDPCGKTFSVLLDGWGTTFSQDFFCLV